MTTTLSPRSTSFENIGKNGYGNIYFNVKGFWSEPVSISISRSYRDAGWKINMHNSCGGRDPLVACDIEAMENFGNAVLFATQVAREYEKEFYRLEAIWLMARAKEKEEYEANLAEQAAQLKANPAFGEAAAKKLFSRFKKHIQTNPNSFIKLVHRGDASKSDVISYNRFKDHFEIMHSGAKFATRLSQRDAVIDISMSSHTSHIIEAV